jgi:two-component system chemotaxis response regulator CheY
MARPGLPVLIVDDNQETRDLLERILLIKGYATATAADGEAALRYLRSGRPACLVILDVLMPVMDGHRFCGELRADPALAGIPVIAYTAGAAVEVPGAVACVRKAVDPDVLLALVERHCLMT